MDEKQLLKRDLVAAVEAAKLMLIKERIKQLQKLRTKMDEMRSTSEEMSQMLEMEDIDLNLLIDKEKRKLENKEMTDNNICCLCNMMMYETDGSHRRVILKCGHIFGQKCIGNYLKLDKSCIVCDAPAQLDDPCIMISGDILYTE